jgi:hypothetical protein
VRTNLLFSAGHGAALLFLIAAADARAQSSTKTRAADQSLPASGSILIVDTLQVRTLQPTSVAGPGVRIEKDGTSVSVTTVLEVSGGSDRAYSLTLRPDLSERALPKEASAGSGTSGNVPATARPRRTDAEGRDVLRIGSQVYLPQHAATDEAATALIGIDYP